MNTKNRVLISTTAAIIFGWFNLATYWWVNSFSSVGTAITETWHGITNNWMNLIILIDSVVFIVLVFVWLLADARKRGRKGYKRWAWVPGILAFGSPALLIYLVSRPDK